MADMTVSPQEMVPFAKDSWCGFKFDNGKDEFTVFFANPRNVSTYGAGQITIDEVIAAVSTLETQLIALRTELQGNREEPQE